MFQFYFNTVCIKLMLTFTIQRRRVTCVLTRSAPPRFIVHALTFSFVKWIALTITWILHVSQSMRRSSRVETFFIPAPVPLRSFITFYFAWRAFHELLRRRFALLGSHFESTIRGLPVFCTQFPIQFYALWNGFTFRFLPLYLYFSCGAERFWIRSRLV